MKRILIPFIVVMLFSSCHNKQKENLCKTWQVSDVIFLNEAESLVQSDTMQGNIQEVTKTLISDVLKKNIHQFNSDGTYLTGNAAAESEGKWELQGQSILFISEKDGKKNEKIIPFEKLTKDTFIMIMKSDQSSMQMKLILTPLTK